jgi:3-oxoacyl-[acyl-carrier protein] reductase
MDSSISPVSLTIFRPFTEFQANIIIIGGGRIIFMSSVAATMSGVPNHALYAGSKAAVEGFTRSFSADAGPKGITVNAIAPGGIKTDMFSANAWHYSPGADPSTSMEDIEKGIASLCPLGRCAVPADIARVVAFLGSADSEWINGKSLTLPVTVSLCSMLIMDYHRSSH